jgi:uncharacterized protein (TIGR00369 family)
MTELKRSEMIERAAGARRKMEESIAHEMTELGADPLPPQQAMTMTGLDFLRRWMQDEIPPPPAIAVLLGMEWIEIEESRVALAIEPTAWMFNPIGMVHGGIAATLLDTVLGSAIHTTLPAATGYATTDLQVRFIRAMNTETGRVIATGTVTHAGRRHATAEGRIEVEATGKLIATGTAGCTIIRAPG